MELTVKSPGQTQRIAKIIRRYSDKGATEYLEKAELRRHIEKAAQDALFRSGGVA